MKIPCLQRSCFRTVDEARSFNFFGEALFARGWLTRPVKLQLVSTATRLLTEARRFEYRANKDLALG